jgi:signal transduction histidine kinase
VEAGAIDLELAEFPVRTLTESIEALFRPIAQSRKLEFIVTLGPDLPATLNTDMHRLQQVLKNLLANAFKFTQRGSVELSIYPVTGGWDTGATALSKAKRVIAFAVKDSGIGIAEDRQKLIFEAFQQADAGTARKYGGTGLGLSISRELASQLKGAITLQSTPGSVSTFTRPRIAWRCASSSTPRSRSRPRFAPISACAAARRRVPSSGARAVKSITATR